MRLVTARSTGRRLTAMLCTVSIAILSPGASHASHESVQGRVGAVNPVFGGTCGGSASCLGFLATGCRHDEAPYKDDQEPFISAKSVAAFTAKDRTAMLRMTASSWPQNGSHTLVLANITNCDVSRPPAGVEFGTITEGQQFQVDVPKGTRWIAVWLFGTNGGLQVDWKLTFNHLT